MSPKEQLFGRFLDNREHAIELLHDILGGSRREATRMYRLLRLRGKVARGCGLVEIDPVSDQDWETMVREVRK